MDRLSLTCCRRSRWQIRLITDKWQKRIEDSLVEHLVELFRQHRIKVGIEYGITVIAQLRLERDISRESFARFLASLCRLVVLYRSWWRLSRFETRR